MLTLLLFATGLLFIIFGATRTTGLNKERFPVLHDTFSTAFFIYGFAVITFTIMLLIAPIPYGEVSQQNVTIINDYDLVTENTSVFDVNGTFTGSSNNSVNLWVNQTKSTDVTYSTAGSDLVFGVFLMNLILLFLYVVLFMLMIFKEAWLRLVKRR